MRVVLSTWGKFHSFHLARQMERFGWLEAIITSYPRFHLRNEGIPPDKILANPWFHLPLVAKSRLGIHNRKFDRAWNGFIDRSQQSFIAKHIPDCDMFIALSGSGLTGGRIVQERGGRWICDRGAAHVGYMDDLLFDEYAAFGARYFRSDPWQIEKELREYECADTVVVPSGFARRSFLAMGHAPARVTAIPMGSDLGRFRRVADPDPDAFVVCYCGRVDFAKGIPHLVQAFRMLKHPRKRLQLIGAIQPEIESYLSTIDLEGVEFVGHVANTALPALYSRADVFVMPSIADGWGMVQTEAMACGVPVISSENTGAADCVEEGVNGFVVPIRSPWIMAERLQQLADDPARARDMGAAARRTIEALGGWDSYGEAFRTLCLSLGSRDRTVVEIV